MRIKTLVILNSNMTTFTMTVFMIIFYSCSSKNNVGKTEIKNDSSTKIVDTVQESSYDSFYDSLANAKVDTSTLEGKMSYIKNHVLVEIAPSDFTYDTMFDVNYDGHKDMILGVYGSAGTGIKNGVRIFIYDPLKNRYSRNELLSGLRNPTFYIKKKKITSFYLPYGAGFGLQLEWKTNMWDTTMEFYVDNLGDSSKWEIKYTRRKTNKTLIRPYQMIPPKDILETQFDEE